MTEHTKGITVTGVEVSSFQRLRLARVEVVPGHGLVKVSGKNGAGKTSLLRAVRAALGGAGQVLADPINDESEDVTGEIRLRLSNNFTVRRRFTEANPKGYLTVEGPDGGKHGQGKLDEWLGPLSFDPLAFFDLKPDRQREILLSLGDDAELPRKLEEVRARRAEKYEERTPWISTRRRVKPTVDAKPEGERPTPIDTSAEMARLRELQAAERERGNAARAWSEAKREFQRREVVVEQQVQRVRELEEALAQAKKELATREHSRDQQERTIEGAEKAYAVLPDPSEEMEQVQARIAQADAVAARIEPWKRWDAARAEYAEASQAVDALTAEIEQTVQEEKALIASAGIPVEGLSFTDDGAPILNGHPLEVASGAERIRLSVAVALAANPQLSICLIDEANDVDLDGLEELDRLGKEHGFQLWACRLGLEGPGEILVEDGEAWGRDDPEEVEEIATDTAAD